MKILLVDLSHPTKTSKFDRGNFTSPNCTTMSYIDIEDEEDVECFYDVYIEGINNKK